MNIAIAGGLGYVGSNLVNYSLAKSNNVDIIDPGYCVYESKIPIGEYKNVQWKWHQKCFHEALELVDSSDLVVIACYDYDYLNCLSETKWNEILKFYAHAVSKKFCLISDWRCGAEVGNIQYNRLNQLEVLTDQANGKILRLGDVFGPQNGRIRLDGILNSIILNLVINKQFVSPDNFCRWLPFTSTHKMADDIFSLIMQSLNNDDNKYFVVYHGCNRLVEMSMRIKAIVDEDLFNNQEQVELGFSKVLSIHSGWRPQNTNFLGYEELLQPWRISLFDFTVKEMVKCLAKHGDSADYENLMNFPISFYNRQRECEALVQKYGIIC